MQKENSGSSQNRKQESMKRQPKSGSGASPGVGGNEYTAAFILYCQKTLDNFRRIYEEAYASEATLGLGLPPGLGSSSGPGFTPNSRSRSESVDDEFGRKETPSSKDKDELEELSKQFEQMLRAKARFDDDELDDDDEKEEDDEAELASRKEREELKGLFGQFEQMLKTEAESGQKLLESDQDDVSKANDSKSKEALKELLEQFEQMLNEDPDLEDNELGLGLDDRSRSNGKKGQPGQGQRTARTAGSPGSYEEEEPSHNAKGPAPSAHGDGLNDAEIDEALSCVGEVIESAKASLGMVEAFWEEQESERARLLVKAEVTQELFEQVVIRVGSHLYDVKDCLEGWGDLSMLPETYEQLLLANNELSEIFQKMYGERKAKVQDRRRELVSEEEDDWEIADDGEEGDWALDDDDWDFAGSDEDIDD
jgi:hypothetical protein